MPRNTHGITEELSREELLQERGLLIGFVQDIRNELISLREQVSILSSKQMAAGEWIELRDWVKMTGEHYEKAKRKCQQGTYKTKPRDKRGEKYYVHRTELDRHKVQAL